MCIWPMSGLKQKIARVVHLYIYVTNCKLAKWLMFLCCIFECRLKIEFLMSYVLDAVPKAKGTPERAWPSGKVFPPLFLIF